MLYTWDAVYHSNNFMVLDYYLFNLDTLKTPPADDFLSPTEQIHFAKFGAKAGCRYVKSRFTIKQVLSRYLGVPTHDVKWAYLASGSPYLPNSQWCFNVSDSGAWLLVGVADGVNVGVDIEKIRAMKHQQTIWSRFLSNQQVEDDDVSDFSDTKSHFFYLWTRWEAWSKCGNQGIHLNRPLPCVINRVVSSPEGFFQLLTKRVDSTDYVFSLCVEIKNKTQQAKWRDCSF